MYNYMTSHTPERPLIYIYYIFSLARSHTQMFIHEHSARRVHTSRIWKLASGKSWSDINLINMMMKWTWNKSLLRFFVKHMNGKRERRRQWKIFHVCSQRYQSQLNASENMSAWEEMTRKLTSMKKYTKLRGMGDWYFANLEFYNIKSFKFGHPLAPDKPHNSQLWMR